MAPLSPSFTRALVTLMLLAVGWQASGQSSPPPQTATPLEMYVHSLLKKVEDGQRTVDQLSPRHFTSLPVGVARKYGETTYVIAIDSAWSDEGGWFFNAYAAITLPGATRPIAFAGKHIAFNQGGISAAQARLELAVAQTIQFNETDLLLPANGNNAVEFDCNGFKALHLKGTFLLGEHLLEPVPVSGPAPPGAPTDRVSATFEAHVSDVNDILVAVTISPFRIAGVNDFTFRVSNAFVDLSDLHNPAGMTLPANYGTAFGTTPELWRGFYLKEAVVQFAALDSSGTRLPTLTAANLLLDGAGVSGRFDGTNLLSLQEGSADGWPISVDRLTVQLLRNRLVEAGFGGNLNVPFLGTENLAYSADIEQTDEGTDYRLAVSLGNDREFTVPLGGKVRLSGTSVVTLAKQNGKLMPSALLHGTLSLNDKLRVSDIGFQDLRLLTASPYVAGGVFTFSGNGQAKAAGFPVRIDDLKLGLSEGKVTLQVRLGLHLMQVADRGFSAETLVQAMANLEVNETTNGGTVIRRQRWRFDRVRFGSVTLDCQTTALHLRGNLNIYDGDPVYGTGLGGQLTFKVPSVMDNPFQARAYFGNKDEGGGSFRYWHVDVYVPTGNIPIAPPLSATGFLGGASYRMSRPAAFSPDFARLAPDQPAVPPTVGMPEFTFVPDATAGLGLMAGVSLICGTEKAFNGDLVLEIAFNQHGGLRYVQFDGSGYFFTGVNQRQRGKDDRAPVHANVLMRFDNDHDLFHANLRTYVNVANQLKGTGPNNLVGEAVIHVDPQNWYIYIGRPTQMMGLDIARLAVAQSYFMIGTQVENLPLPPSQVQELFNNIGLSSMRDQSALSAGRGFAMGARFTTGFDSGDKLSPFYTMMQLGGGADVMVRNYGLNATCVGRSGPLGIDGWYAQGQAYLFLVGRVGVKVKGRRFDFLRLGAAALLQAKLPNPAWLRGGLAGQFSVLGGLVQGRFNVTVVVGEECEIMSPGNELGEIAVIEALKPDQGGTDVSVFSAPQVSFNVEIGTEIRMDNLQGEYHTYRVQLDELTLLQTGNNQPVTAQLEWNQRRDVAILRTAEILPPQTNLRLTARVHWEKREGGSWQALTDNGQVAYETKQVTFTTGTAPDFIPDENVLYSYPIKHQYHFHKDEYGQGYVKLRQGQAYLFTAQDAETRWRFQARIQPVGGTPLEVPIAYDAAQATVRFALPPGMTNEMVYKLNFIKVPEITGGVDANVQRREKTVSNGSSEITVRSNQLAGTLVQAIEKEIYASDFRTSRFATFSAKMASLGNGRDEFDVATGNVLVLGKRTAAVETFDQFELTGSVQRSPLVRVAATRATPWYTTHVFPLLYEHYKQDADIDIDTWRTPDEQAVEPLQVGVQLYNVGNAGDYQLTDNQITSGTAPARPGDVILGYYLSYYTVRDFNELRNKAASKYLNGTSTSLLSISRLLTGSYTDLTQGSYPTLLTYTLPGMPTPAYQQEWRIQW